MTKSEPMLIICGLGFFILVMLGLAQYNANKVHADRYRQIEKQINMCIAKERQPCYMRIVTEQEAQELAQLKIQTKNYGVYK